MNTARGLRRRRSRGFTLIEAIVVALILTIVSVGISRVQGGLFTTQSTMSDMQIRTALVQECAEQILGRRRFTTAVNGYENGVTSTDFGTNLCGGMTAPTGYSVPSVTLTDYSGGACPTNTTCKTATIASGSMQALSLLLVDY